MARAHPENAAGPFYVEDGCCISCGTPIDVAPDIFDWAKDGSHCVVKRQPAGAADLDRTMIAICRAEVDCIRYRGDNPLIARRIAESGNPSNCDVLPAGASPRLRSRVRFATDRPGDTPAALAARLRTWLIGARSPFTTVKPRRPWSPSKVTFCWDHGLLWRAHFHTVRFEAATEGRGFGAILKSGWRPASVGLSLAIDEWLRDAERVRDMRWYARDEDWDRDPGFHMPV